MTMPNTAKWFYAILIFYNVYSFNIDGDESFTGIFVQDFFPGFFSLDPIFFISEMLNLIVFLMSFVFYFIANDFSKNHFLNIVSINVFVMFLLIYFYSYQLQEQTDPSNEVPARVMVIIAVGLVYAIWRLLRGTYLVFRGREMPKYF